MKKHSREYYLLGFVIFGIVFAIVGLVVSLKVLNSYTTYGLLFTAVVLSLLFMFILIQLYIESFVGQFSYGFCIKGVLSKEKFKSITSKISKGEQGIIEYPVISGLSLIKGVIGKISPDINDYDRIYFYAEDLEYSFIEYIVSCFKPSIWIKATVKPCEDFIEIKGSDLHTILVEYNGFKNLYSEKYLDYDGFLYRLPSYCVISNEMLVEDALYLVRFDRKCKDKIMNNTRVCYLQANLSRKE